MSIRDFIERQDKDRRDLLRYFHHLFAEEMELEAKIRYKVPFYFRHSWICYLNPVKPEGIELVMLRGNELSNAQGLLEARGRKQVSGIIFTNVSEIQTDLIREILHEAIILDETVPYASKRSKK
ncbi:MAG: DUF1801 domain-containing protein [Bacteroidota bacterium]